MEVLKNYHFVFRVLIRASCFLYSGPKPKVAETAFEDLLGGHTFTSTKKEPRTIKEMRKTLDATSTDPDTLKVLYNSLLFVFCKLRGHPFMMSTRRGMGAWLRWTHVDGGRSQAPCGRPRRKLKLETTDIFFSCKEVGIF